MLVGLIKTLRTLFHIKGNSTNIHTAGKVVFVKSSVTLLKIKAEFFKQQTEATRREDALRRKKVFYSILF